MLAAVVDADHVRVLQAGGGVASRRNRSTNSASWAKRRCSTLSATSRPRWVSSARYTSAMPPEPIRPRIL